MKERPGRKLSVAVLHVTLQISDLWKLAMGLPRFPGMIGAQDPAALSSIPGRVRAGTAVWIS